MSSPRSLLLFSLRAGFLACLIGSILQPAWISLEGRQEKPRLAVVVDRSHWMAARDGKTTRLDAALLWLRRHRALIEKRSEAAYYLIGERAEPASFEELSRAKPDASQLVLERAFSDPWTQVRPSAVWLLSDGAGDSSEDLEGSLAKLGVPVNALGVGLANKPRGLAIAGLQAPDLVFLHESFSLQLHWEASGLAGSRVRLRLLRGEAPVAKAAAGPLRDFESRTTTFTVVPGGLGAENYQLELTAPGTGSPSLRRAFRVEVIRQKLRIMFLCGRPSFEYASLRELLKSDPNHELISFVILRNPENLTPAAENELSLIPFPAQEIFVQTLSRFDVFILQDFASWRFNLPPFYLESLKSFVERGGGLLLIGGDQAFARGGYAGTPLEDILPVKLLGGGKDFSPGLFQAQPLALDHPLVKIAGDQPARDQWSALPPLEGFNRFLSMRSDATALAAVPGQTLAGGGPLPLFSIREVGKGHVMLSATNSTWRWKLGSARRWGSSGFYASFWTRAIQYLSGGLNLKRVQFAPLPASFSRAPVDLRLRVFDESFRPFNGAGLRVKFLWTGPGGAAKEVPAQELETGVFQAKLEGLGPGVHRVKGLARYRGRVVGEDEVSFVWAGAGGDEFKPVDQALLRRVAAATGGEYSPLGEAPFAAWLDKLPPPVKTSRVVRRRGVWRSSLWLWGMLLLLGIEWSLRRKWSYP